jgi:predicted metal-binding protein
MTALDPEALVRAALEAAAEEAEEHKLFAKGLECLPGCIRAIDPSAIVARVKEQQK